jgi:hypothetical protein
MKPGLIVGYPQMKEVGSEWHPRREPTGKTLKAIVMEVAPRLYDSNSLDIRGYTLTKDGKISRSGWSNYGDNLQLFDNVDQIIGPADEELIREARGLMLSGWVHKADPQVRQKAIEDAEFFARVRAADWKPDVQRVLIAEAKGVTVDDVALRQRAEQAVDYRCQIDKYLDHAIHDSAALGESVAEFGMDGKMKEAFALIVQAKTILDSLTVETLLEKVKV